MQFMNDPGARAAPHGIGGWLLLLCVLLLAGQPASLALTAASAMGALSVRGLPLALLLVVRTIVAGVGVAAGIVLARRQAGAVTLAQAALALSAVMDIFVYTTSFFPNNRMPGDTPLYAAASLSYHAAWMLYLLKSKRVRNTFGD